MKKAQLTIQITSTRYGVKTATGSITIVNEEIQQCPVAIGDKTIEAYVLGMEMRKYDLILGMDWMARVQATVDYRSKEIIFYDSEGNLVIFTGNCKKA